MDEHHLEIQEKPRLRHQVDISFQVAIKGFQKLKVTKTVQAATKNFFA
jgi:hypothetical protein